MASHRVNVSLSEDGLDRFPQVVAALKAAGLRVEAALESVGAVTGEVDGPEAVEKLRLVVGVSAVETQREVSGLNNPHRPGSR
jgi:hypothetical protein